MGNYKFDVKDATEKCVSWIRDFYENNGKGCMAVVGISGGKDSSVAAGLCVRALGKDRVLGVLMPNGIQSDIDVSKRLVAYLGIRNVTINIATACDSIENAIAYEMGGPCSEQTHVNLPARIRMSTLYAVSQSVNGRVCNTCNYSEDYVGYATRYGDGAGDFSPLSMFTVEEIKAIGRYLGLPNEFVDKTPIDGLCGKSDEENLGFTYQMLDDYLRRGIEPPADIKARIDRMHEKNLFKLKLMPVFDYFGTLQAA